MEDLALWTQTRKSNHAGTTIMFSTSITTSMDVFFQLLSSLEANSFNRVRVDLE
jgi:hypothetical protein